MRFIDLIFAAVLFVLSSTSARAQSDTSVYDIHFSNTVLLDSTLASVQEYKLPEIYLQWFKQVVECEGIPLPPKEELDRLRFFVINAPSFTLGNNPTQYAGVTYSKQHLIFIALPYTGVYSIVAHEFLHFALWYQYGSKYDIGSGNTHPIEYFGKCSINRF